MEIMQQSTKRTVIWPPASTAMEIASKLMDHPLAVPRSSKTVATGKIEYNDVNNGNTSPHNNIGSGEASKDSDPIKSAPNTNFGNQLKQQSVLLKVISISMAVIVPLLIAVTAALVWYIVKHDNSISELRASINDLYSKTDTSSSDTQDSTDSGTQDCQDHYSQGDTISGIKNIKPPGSPSTGYDVYCDMDTDAGGWIVFQRRVDGTLNFSRNWDSYKNGFGDPAHEFWIGNDVLHVLTSYTTVRLRVDLWNWEGEHRSAEYTSFSVEDESSDYRMTYGRFDGGDAMDSMDVHNGYPFSTYDNDLDNSVENCAIYYDGPWWHNTCFRSSLNGPYQNSSQVPSEALGIIWHSWTGYYYSLMKTEMKIRQDV